jgi:protein-disulfide isomerase
MNYFKKVLKKYKNKEKELEDKIEEVSEKIVEVKEVINGEPKITMPTAIIVAGVLVMIGLLATGGINGGSANKKDKTLSEQVGINKDKFTQCLKDTDLKSLVEKTATEAEAAMKGIPADERGTPYSVIIGQNGSKSQIRGAYPKEEVQKLIDEVKAGKVTTVYTGDIEGYREGDHIIGNPNAPILIIEYSDLECPYCKKFGETMKEIVAESNGEVAWVYRHWIVHQGAVAKAAAAECVAKIKGNDSFWKYIDLVFGLMDPVEPEISDQL